MSVVSSYYMYTLYRTWEVWALQYNMLLFCTQGTVCMVHFKECHLYELIRLWHSCCAALPGIVCKLDRVFFLGLYML